MAGMKCVALRSDGDRVLVDAAIQEAQQQGATVNQIHLFWLILCLWSQTATLTFLDVLIVQGSVICIMST